MQYKLVKPQKLKDIATGCLVIPVWGDRALWKKKTQCALLEEINQLTEGMLMKALQQGDLPPKTGKTLMLPVPMGMKAHRLLLVYAGKKNSVGQKNALGIAKGVASKLTDIPSKSATLIWAELKLEKELDRWFIQQTVYAIENAIYQFDNYKSSSKKPPSLSSVTITLPAGSKATARTLKEAQAIAEGVVLSKDLGNTPANQCTPTVLAKKAVELGKRFPALKVSVLDEKEMKKLAMGALLSVSAGSREPAKLIVLEYQAGKKAETPTVLIGKGITFDTGGISLKPGGRMDEMKFDMCGAATVFGVLLAALKLKLPINLVGIIAASENMPDGNATKPGDVVTSMSGKTIEVLNTDAEGRLVLCDAITYAEKFKPGCVIDIATLTGACVVALGSHASGLYANDDELADKLLSAGKYSGDKAWRMPLWNEYQEQINSKVADVANIGGPGAGSITAACFLERFAKDFRWAHLDVAGSAWNGKRSTGRPVPLLCHFLLNK